MDRVQRRREDPRLARPREDYGHSGDERCDLVQETYNRNPELSRKYTDKQDEVLIGSDCIVSYFNALTDL